MFLNAATILCLHGKIGNANTENSIRKDGVFCDRIGTTDHAVIARSEATWQSPGRVRYNKGPVDKVAYKPFLW